MTLQKFSIAAHPDQGKLHETCGVFCEYFSTLSFLKDLAPNTCFQMVFTKAVNSGCKALLYGHKCFCNCLVVGLVARASMFLLIFILILYVTSSNIYRSTKYLRLKRGIKNTFLLYTYLIEWFSLLQGCS